MADPNHADSIAQIHACEREIEALENKISATDESTTEPTNYAAMRREQEEHRQRILKSKAGIDQNKWAEPQQE